MLSAPSERVNLRDFLTGEALPSRKERKPAAEPQANGGLSLNLTEICFISFETNFVNGL